MRGNFLNSRGFTLIEVLASVVLLAVVISISLSIFPNMFRTNDVNEQSLDAVAVAKDVLVRAKTSEYKPFILATTATSKYGVAIPANTYYKELTPASGFNALILTKNQDVDSLNLFETTVHVIQGTSIRATNYGYLTGDDFK